MNEVRKRHKFIPPEANNCYLMRENAMDNIEQFKTIKENGLHDGDKICVIV